MKKIILTSILVIVLFLPLAMAMPIKEPTSLLKRFFYASIITVCGVVSGAAIAYGVTKNKS